MPRLVHLEKMPSRRMRPPATTLPAWVPGSSGLAILRLLYRYRYLTSELLGMLYEDERDRGASQVRHHLTELWRYGYVERFFRPAERGSTQYVYVITGKGARAVFPEDWAADRFRIQNLARPRGDYEHLLAVSLLQVLWDLGKGSIADRIVEKAYWVDKEGDATHVRNRFTVKLDGKATSVKPDTTVLITNRARGFSRPIFFEIERTHKNHQRTRERFRIYGELLGAQHAAAGAVFKRETGKVPEKGAAVFVGAHQRHAEALRAAALEALGLEGRGATAMPEMWFTSIDAFFEERDGEERIISPAALFTRPLAISLAGKHGTLIA